MEFLTECRVRARDARVRIDKYLARRYGYLSRSEWQRHIGNGKIRHNGTVLSRHDKKIAPGDHISFAGRDAPEPEVNTNYTVLYEDDHFIGVNKPANIPVHPAGVYYHNTLLTILQARFNGKLHLVNRLDRETSGVILIAKDPRSADLVHANFGSVRKSYIALVHGVPLEHDFIVDIPIGPAPFSEAGHRRAAFPDAKDGARTRFITLASFYGYTLVKAVPFTGRQHQIRVHLRHAGYPVAGDKLYGVKSPGRRCVSEGACEAMQVPEFTRSALHSRSIQFYHPWLRAVTRIKAPLAEDMKSYINRMQRQDG
jgi:23S rRNA pseudouridine1911/1915/1917 synthase